jgi:hypothetical protein
LVALHRTSTDTASEYLADRRWKTRTCRREHFLFDPGESRHVIGAELAMTAYGESIRLDHVASEMNMINHLLCTPSSTN